MGNLLTDPATWGVLAIGGLMIAWQSISGPLLKFLKGLQFPTPPTPPPAPPTYHDHETVNKFLDVVHTCTDAGDKITAKALRELLPAVAAVCCHEEAKK